MVLPYGGYALQRGDWDVDFTYGGQKRSVATGEKGYIQQLQEDLRQLGFLIVTKAERGVFDLTTECAVREFQIYAKLDRIAKQISKDGERYVDNLQKEPELNTNKYETNQPISGVVNARTAELIQHWLKNSWRCPVVIFSKQKGNQPLLGSLARRDNLWLYNDIQTENLQIVVRDFSQHYAEGLPSV
jgi:hypothetical protein